MADFLGFSLDLASMLDSTWALLSASAARKTGSLILTLRLAALNAPLPLHWWGSSLLAQAPDLNSKTTAPSSSLPHAGNWLHVIPSCQLGLAFLDQEFHFCSHYWLGIDTYGGAVFCSLEIILEIILEITIIGCGGNRNCICHHDSIWDVLLLAE